MPEADVGAAEEADMPEAAEGWGEGRAWVALEGKAEAEMPEPAAATAAVRGAMVARAVIAPGMTQEVQTDGVVPTHGCRLACYRPYLRSRRSNTDCRCEARNA